MQILAPVGSVKDVPSLISSGAGELYCGLQPAAWNNTYGKKIWCNRRGPGTANIESLKELQKVTEFAHKHNVQVFLTLNLPFYPPEQYPEIVSMVEEVKSQCGIDALIIADPGLIIAIKKAIPGMEIHVSSLAAVLNSASAAFFRDLGVSRIIFPRYIDLDELRVIIDKVGPEVEYEVFILNDGCVFEEGYCNISHAFGGAFCHRPWSYRLIEAGREKKVIETFNNHLKDYQNWLWYVRNCIGHLSFDGYPKGMCGLCALPELKAVGVKSLKIVGREVPLSKKISSVKLVKKVLDFVQAGEEPELVKTKAKKIRNTKDLCSSGYMCYYR